MGLTLDFPNQRGTPHDGHLWTSLTGNPSDLNSHEATSCCLDACPAFQRRPERQSFKNCAKSKSRVICLSNSWRVCSQAVTLCRIPAQQPRRDSEGFQKSLSSARHAVPVFKAGSCFRHCKSWWSCAFIVVNGKLLLETSRQAIAEFCFERSVGFGGGKPFQHVSV